jgi:hypothetical protein
MTEEEKKKKAIAAVDREIEKLKGSFSADSCEVMRELWIERMFADIEKLQPK